MTSSLFPKYFFIHVLFLSITKRQQFLVSAEDQDNISLSVPKCCKLEEIIVDQSCGISKHKWLYFTPNASVYFMNETHVDNVPAPNVRFSPYVQNIDCDMGKYPLNPVFDVFALFSNGSLVILTDRFTLSPKQFCFETVNIADDDEAANWATVPFRCVPSLRSLVNDILLTIYFTGMAVSTIFLLAIIYLQFVAVKKHSSKDKHIVLFSGTLLANYGIIVAAQLGAEGATCTVLAVILYINLMSSFTILSSMCLEIYFKVKNIAAGLTSQEKVNGQPAIILWASTFLLSLITIVAANSSSSSVPRDFLMPHFGYNTCWFRSSPVNAFFFSIPMLVLIAANIVITVLTCLQIKKCKPENENNGELEKEIKFHKVYRWTIIMMCFHWVSRIACIVFQFDASSVITVVSVLDVGISFTLLRVDWC